MQNTETKTNNSVKSKLVAAIAMLLVATIMVVSSTYAWFTLSTKPEVTGISTAVGANGALEMLLATKDADGNWVYKNTVVDTNASWEERNTNWGNLVNLSDLYGSEMITLYPSSLNVTAQGYISETPISFPKYGADGRVHTLQPGGEFGTYDGENFFKNEDFGFRALGTTSGMTARQQSFKVALAQVAINQSTAKSEARESLAANGTQLAAIAVKKGMNTSDQYDAKDSAAAKAMVTGIEKSLTALETAYLEALYTAVYSKKNTTATTDEAVANQITTIKAAANGKTALGEKIAAALGVAGVDTSILQGYDKFETAVSDFNTAKSAIDGLGETGTLTTLIDALRPLVDVEAVSVNGYKGTEISANKNAIVTDVMANGAKVHIGNDGGVYGTIAELCGKYNASIQIELSAIDSTFTEGSLPADMTVGDNQQGTLNAVRTALDAEYPTADGATNPISEFYGYVIDLAFRTNAANSNLLLQTTAADRIYGDNQNEETLGKGSTMTFNTDFTVFSEDQMKDLMEHIKLVFFETDNADGMKVIKYAKLDAENAKQAADGGLEANIYLLDDSNNPIKNQEDAVIQAMNTNQPTHVSVLVYLDGETLTNADVAATLAESMSGKLNLQFASSADLVPMDYADLHHKTATENNGGDAQG